MIREKANLTSGGFFPSPGLALWRVRCSGVSPPVSSPLHFGLNGGLHATKNELPLLTLGLKVPCAWALRGKTFFGPKS